LLQSARKADAADFTHCAAAAPVTQACYSAHKKTQKRNVVHLSNQPALTACEQPLRGKPLRPL